MLEGSGLRTTHREWPCPASGKWGCFGNYSSIFPWRGAALVSVFQCPLGADVLGGCHLLSEFGQSTGKWHSKMKIDS